MRRVRELPGRIAAWFGELPARDRRALTIGMAILLPVVVWIGAVRPYLAAAGELQDRVAAERQLLEREWSVLGRAHTFPERLRETRQALDLWRARLIATPNLALAEAEVTAWLEEVARESRLLLEEVRSVSPPPGYTVPAGLEPVRLSVEGESDFAGVLRFLHRLEEDPMLVRIAGLSVERAGGEDGRAQPGAMRFVAVVETFAPDESATQEPDPSTGQAPDASPGQEPDRSGAQD